jgi:hypothetical protein
MRLPSTDGTVPLTLRKKLDNDQPSVAARSIYLQKMDIILFTNYFDLYLDLMDYPESDDDGALATDGAAMLDEDDTEQGDAANMSATGRGGIHAGPSCSTDSANLTPAGQKCLSTGSSFMSCGSQDKPEFPPIYRTVRKEREKSMVTRHLYGGANTEAECTDSGASVSKVETIGSFANAGDKRHNHTMHRYNFKNVRNLSTSFNASTLICMSCPNEHTVLRREVGRLMSEWIFRPYSYFRIRLPLNDPCGGGGGR